MVTLIVTRYFSGLISDILRKWTRVIRIWKPDVCEFCVLKYIKPLSLFYIKNLWQNMEEFVGKVERLQATANTKWKICFLGTT